VPAAPLPALPGVRHRTVTVQAADGPLDLHVADAGDGPALLLLHGWPQHWWSWRRVIGQLAADFRLVVPDHRGFGWSAAPGRGYDPLTFAADAVALLDALGIERAGVIGHDWGGFTAYVLGMRHPARVTAVLACNAPHPWVALDRRAARGLWRAWYVALVASPIGARAVASPGFLPWWLRLGGRGHVFDDAQAEAYAAPLREPARARASQQLYRAYLALARDIFQRRAFDTERLTVPARALFGARDVYIPVVNTLGAEPHADDWGVALLEDCGHWTPEERPETVGATARDLFAH
jgi:pimeloyl-ACP methyl ester carboxylesterase